MKLSHVAPITLFLSLICITTVYSAEGFTYHYTDPAAADASKYITDDSTNVELVQEGVVTYWKPIYGSDHEENTMPGIIYYHFTFDKTIESGFLKMYIASFHWSYSQGRTFIYASTDGKNWIKLAEAAPPEEGKATWGGFDGVLPDALLHKRELHLKAVLYSYGEKAYLGGAYTNTAQHSRYQRGSDVRTFELGVVFDDKWIQKQINIKTTFTDKDGKQVTLSNLVPGESSTIDVQVKNPTNTVVHGRLSFGLHIGEELKKIGKVEFNCDPGLKAYTSASVQTPPDAAEKFQKLTIVLEDTTTDEILDIYEPAVFVGTDNFLPGLAAGILLLLAK